MYPVSKAFQEAIRKPQRITSVRGALHLKDVSGQKGFDESAIVQKSLQITDQLNSGKFGYGSVYSRNMSVKLDYTKIDGVEGVNINLTNATIVLWFKLTLADGTEEEILLGNFLIDSAKSSRKFNILSIYANDYLPKLGVPSVPVSNLTPYQIFTEACGLSKQGTGNKEDFVNALPNGDKTFTFDTSQIQTAWDMVMWVSQITGTFVRAKRQDEPCPQLVQIPTKYTKGGINENFDLETFKAENGSIIPADVRFSTDFTDTSIRNTTLLMNVKGKMFKSHRNWTFAPDTLEGTLELKSNPLLEGKTEGEIQAIIDNIQDYTDDLRFCPFKTTFNGNPAIEVGDFVYLEPGGAVDETKYRHYGIVTYSKWVYRGKCEIRCAADMTAERPSTTAAASAKSANGMMRAAPKAASDVFGVQPKSQLEKRMDGLEAQDRVKIDHAIIVSQYTSEYLKYNYTILPLKTYPKLYGGSAKNPVICGGLANGAECWIELRESKYDENGTLKSTTWWLNWIFGDGTGSHREFLLSGESAGIIPEAINPPRLFSMNDPNPNYKYGSISVIFVYKVGDKEYSITTGGTYVNIGFTSMDEYNYARGVISSTVDVSEVDMSVTKVAAQITPGSIPIEDSTKNTTGKDETQ